MSFALGILNFDRQRELKQQLRIL